MILLTPGPCMTSEDVRLAAASLDLNHRQPEYPQLMHDLRARLLRVYPDTVTGWEPYLIGGSGTAAVEAMLTSCVEKGPLLILVNGYYSRRLAEIATIHGIPHEVLEFDWEVPMDVSRVDQALNRQTYEALVMTHDETTMGWLNPVGLIGRLCRAKGVRLLLDAMSSFGADEIEFQYVDALVASANKCLHGLPGVGFVLTTAQLADQMEAFPRRTFYLHLSMLRGVQPPLTPPIPTLQAFREALAANEGGHNARMRSYLRKDRELRRGLAKLGLRCPVEPEQASLSVVTATLPAGWSYDRWFEANYHAGYVIYGTKEHLRDRYFQVSVMGETTVETIHHWITVAEGLLASAT